MSRPVLSHFTFLLILSFSLLLTACGGGYVDTDGGSFVDRESAGGFDRESTPITTTPTPATPVVVNASSDDFMPPPSELAVESTTDSESLPYEQSFVGKNAVSAWVWNDRGSQKLFLPDGSRITLDKLGITVEVIMIAPSADSGSAVVFALNEKQLPALHEDEQVKVGRTYIYVKDVYVK